MLGEALRLIRVFHDLKQSELAERLEISQSLWVHPPTKPVWRK